MQSPSNSIVLTFKDVFREMRYSVRHEAELIDRRLDAIGGGLRDRAAPFLPLSETPILHLTDAVFGSLEKAASLAFTPAGRGASVFPDLKPLTALTMLDGGRRRLADSRFIEALYGLARDMLRMLGVQNLLLSEQALDAACHALTLRHAELIGAVTEASPRRLAEPERLARIRLCAAFATELNRARPIRRLDLPVRDNASRHLFLSPNLYCFTVTSIGLAIVSTTALDADTTALDVMEAANAVTDARFSRFSAAITSRDPIATLTREMQVVLPYLP